MVIEFGKGLEHKSGEERLGELGVFSPDGEKGAQGDLKALHCKIVRERGSGPAPREKGTG